MSMRTVAVRLSRILARAGMNALLDSSAPGTRRAGRSERRHDGRGPSEAGASGARGRRAGPQSRETGRHPAQTSETTRPATRTGAYPGDWTAPLPPTQYAPLDNGLPDPGEVVWAWVPYEEDHAQGKDRPVLVVAHHPDDRGLVLALPLTSKDHDRDAAQEARAGRHWMDVGSGAWDQRGRPSEARLDRVLQVDITSVRREGSRIDAHTFDAVVTAARALNP